MAGRDQGTGQRAARLRRAAGQRREAAAAGRRGGAAPWPPRPPRSSTARRSWSAGPRRGPASGRQAPPAGSGRGSGAARCAGCAHLGPGRGAARRVDHPRGDRPAVRRGRRPAAARERTDAWSGTARFNMFSADHPAWLDRADQECTSPWGSRCRRWCRRSSGRCCPACSPGPGGAPWPRSWTGQPGHAGSAACSSSRHRHLEIQNFHASPSPSTPRTSTAPGVHRRLPDPRGAGVPPDGSPAGSRSLRLDCAPAAGDQTRRAGHLTRGGGGGGGRAPSRPCAPLAARPDHLPPRPAGRDRRRLATLAGLVVGQSIAGWTWRTSLFGPRGLPRCPGLPPGQPDRGLDRPDCRGRGPWVPAHAGGARTVTRTQAELLAPATARRGTADRLRGGWRWRPLDRRPAGRPGRLAGTLSPAGARVDSIQQVGASSSAVLSAGQVADPQSLLAVTLNGHAALGSRLPDLDDHPERARRAYTPNGSARSLSSSRPDRRGCSGQDLHQPDPALVRRATDPPLPLLAAFALPVTRSGR